MPDDRPNIILIMTDQQRFDTIRALGFPYMDTPNLDRLVEEGIALTNCFCTAPSCAPSRAALFTGGYPHSTGVFKNADKWPRTWVEDLAESGYHCVNIGKMHTYPYQAPYGFHERYVVENKDRYLEGRYFFDEWDKALHARGLPKPGRVMYRNLKDYRERMGAFEWELPEDMHPDMFVGGMATWWIDRYPKTTPLFLQIGFPGPHPPYDPPLRYAKPYLKKDLPIPAVSERDLASQPPPFLALRKHNSEVDHDSVVFSLNPSREQLHRMRAYYLANVTMIDEKIGEILQALEAKGYLENAVVIFTSDHGDCLGDHGHVQKWTMYDEIVKMPAIIWSPGRFDGGQRLDNLYSQIDIGATILELADLQIPANMEAESLIPALEGRGTEGRKCVFAEHSRDAILRETEFMTMVRTKDWKLVHFLDEPFGQLFDLKNDPKEVNNLWDDPRYADQKEALMRVMLNWLIRSNYRSRSQQLRWG
ncbi:MAG TPA: sulfatase-like hydrolase/transferase [Thermosynergistes sp.]|nr:sulfatase-like hydrolase/transferase [Thermosynergistes sp.]HXK89942.1 sulfatase-like hydrolase/transferase [Thermosynergistes sp.]